MFHSTSLIQGTQDITYYEKRSADLSSPHKLVLVITCVHPRPSKSCRCTPKTWSKHVGDSVAADKDMATIEMDKIDVSVNTPQAGEIVELLAQEEDTGGQVESELSEGWHVLGPSSAIPEWAWSES